MLKNPNLALMESDHLYHCALDTSQHDLVAMFADVKHGMGMPSASIMLHEMMKLVHHAGCMKDVVFIRTGTCGSIGLEPGNLIVSEEVVNGLLEPYQELAILGKRVVRPAIMNKALAYELQALRRPDDPFDVVLGKTMCTDDFYEGQGRLDGAICEFTKKDKLAFLKVAYEKGIRNMEMESLCFAAMCHHAGIKSAVVCVAIVNRLDGDQVTTAKETLTEWEWNPIRLVTRLIKKRLAEHELREK